MATRTYSDKELKAVFTTPLRPTEVQSVVRLER
jgi:hypothetical protein